MKKLIAVILFSILVGTTQAQNITYPCGHQDIFDIYQILVAELSDAVPAVDAQDTEAFFEALEDLENTVQEMRELCLEGGVRQAAGDVGDRRTNPVPFGERAYIRGGTLGVRVHEVRERYIGTDRFIEAKLSISCERSLDATCTAYNSDWLMVGSESEVYGRYLGVDWEYSVSLFGGGEGIIDFATRVEPNENNFVLMYIPDYGSSEGRTYFSLGQ